MILVLTRINLVLGCWEITQDCLMMYLDGKPPANQFLCRAYLCQGQLISSRSISTAEDLDKAVMYYLKAIEIAKDKSRYHFLVFNASLLYLQSVRRFLRPGQRRLLVSSLTQVLGALEEVQDPDHAWRAELMLHLVECLLDAGKQKEAAAVAKVTSDLIQAHKPELYPRLFSIQVNLSLLYCVINPARNIRSISAEFRSCFSQLWLSVIARLDALLQTALKQADARVTQAVCVCQWNTCLPLLQHNLRKRVQKALLTLARALQHTHSLLLDVLCRVHTELAAIDEEDEKLESAMKHLQKALELDPLSQQLSSSLQLLQLRSSVHSAPTRPEERAAKLIQQAKEGSGREALRKRRPLLVSAGVALAPDAFQTVLDADTDCVSLDDGAGDRLELLAAKAQHHSSCVQKVKGHLDGLDKSSDDKERVKLWGSLAKTARKQEVFDVCQAACRFCLLYDDGRWKNTIIFLFLFTPIIFIYYLKKKKKKLLNNIYKIIFFFLLKVLILVQTCL
uniref:Cilia and flagella associated protein 46 n=1 Tax=Cyprinus carpio TaxID=7962 RepID=A0A8C1PJM6_CYPCA